ncbi:hypothetical protein ZYGR_0AY02040 [Zygosaccharomyces rouxii]|uniref:Nucleoporin NUP60 n=1 Tax=Zygosaccharomyces rouxii TaxID=4956 RepID=A0A1Q3AJA0_ZYGRO|nr:hypothetical protein ZYGR_0AY02040 [Zygosaccharomyces rouxii]
MVDQGKSYLSGGVMAPYKRPMSSRNRDKPSILNKLKSFFTNDGNGRQEHSGFKKRHLASGRNPAVSIPGGFFNSDDTSPSIVLPKSQGGSQISNSTPDVNAVNGEQREEEISSDEESYNADISNAKLADFFSRKGGEPLSEMEMEGVKSLMRKSSKTVRSSRAGSIANTTLSHDDPADLVYSRILKHSRTPSLAASTMRAPAFTPKYDDSFGSHSFANTSKGSVSSRRRVFDYSSLPSPYKTTVYKYSAADSDSSDAHDGTKAPDASKSMVVKPSSGKKLSNTASALVSLLENDNSKDETSNRLANPYSSHVNQLRKYKKNLPTLPTTKQETTKFAPIKSSALQELENAKAKPTNEIAPKPQQHSSVDKYKPMRSSSLRSNVVKADESPERKATTKEAEPEVPNAPTFNFQFQTKDKIEPNTSSQPQPQPVAKPGFAFKFQPQKFGLPDNNSDSDVVDKISTKASTAYSTAAPTAPTKSGPRYDFGRIAPSKIDPSAVDDKKVQDFKTLFAF